MKKQTKRKPKLVKIQKNGKVWVHPELAKFMGISPNTGLTSKEYSEFLADKRKSLQSGMTLSEFKKKLADRRNKK